MACSSTLSTRSLTAALLGLLLTVPTACASESVSGHAIKLNQLGFTPLARKLAVVPGSAAESFEVRTPDGTVVLAGKLTPAQHWPFSDEEVQIADLSALRTPGHYLVAVTGVGESPPFRVHPDVHRPLVSAALKAFYFARSLIDLEPTYAGQWARAGGHPDDQVLIHRSAASAERPEGSLIASPGGWYDAGDYNKYIVNASFATATLLSAYEHFPQYFDRLSTGIPESDNQIPDIIDEAVFNLRWMLSMQDPNDGGVYHKLTTLSFAGMVMPDQATAPRYVVQKSTQATLDLAATAAMAARILGRWPQLQVLAGECLAAAKAAWAWAETNPGVVYRQPADVHTGTYAVDGDSFADERVWAAVELFVTSGDEGYLTGVELSQLVRGVPSWPWVSPFAWSSLIHNDVLLPGLSRAEVEQVILETAELLRSQAGESAYRVALGASPSRFMAHHPKSDFSWGSNGVAACQSMVLLWAHRITGDVTFLDTAVANLDYLLGRNATGYCFVTGFGSLSPQHPHHRPSEADGIAEPVPGFLVGGPNGNRQDEGSCVARFPSLLPAMAYLDHVCSYATNEVAINWNAALVYVAGAVDALTRGDTPRRARRVSGG